MIAQEGNKKDTLRVSRLYMKSAPCERNDLSSRGLAPQYFRRGGA